MKSWTLERVSQWVSDNLILILALVAAGVLVFTITKVVSVSHKADRTARQAKTLSRQAKALSLQNKQLIATQQASRLESCRRTYEGVREVLRPLFPPPQGRTPKQQKDLDKFNGSVDRLKRGCVGQTKSQGGKQ